MNQINALRKFIWTSLAIYAFWGAISFFIFFFFFPQFFTPIIPALFIFFFLLNVFVFRFLIKSHSLSIALFSRNFTILTLIKFFGSFILFAVVVYFFQYYIIPIVIVFFVLYASSLVLEIKEFNAYMRKITAK
jgi:hypothetical protein